MFKNRNSNIFRLSNLCRSFTNSASIMPIMAINNQYYNYKNVNKISSTNKNLLDANKLYNLEGKENICHVSQWELSKDFIKVCQTCELSEIKKFYEMYVKNYQQKLYEYSNGTYTFYDRGWNSNGTITFDIYGRFMNYNFRELIFQNKNVSKELIEWFMSLKIIEKGHYHCALNVLCNTGGFETAKLMHEVQPFDFKWKPEKKEYHLDYFRSASSNNHLEMAKWLYELKAHENYEFGYDNIKRIVNERANEQVKNWLNSLEEFK